MVKMVRTSAAKPSSVDNACLSVSYTQNISWRDVLRDHQSGQQEHTRRSSNSQAERIGEQMREPLNEW